MQGHGNTVLVLVLKLDFSLAFVLNQKTGVASRDPEGMQTFVFPSIRQTNWKRL